MEAEAHQPQTPIETEPATERKAVVDPMPSPKPRRSRKLLFAVCSLLVVLAVGIAWSWWLFGRNAPYNENQNIDTNGFQAVFLTNGQVYFGKLADLNHKYVTITDIYYLQVQSNTGLQGSSSSGSNSNSQVSLAKLGSELHGPKDKMYIANDQMLFWENLKSDSKVVQAIDKYQAQ
jgi:hypothetical protein